MSDDAQQPLPQPPLPGPMRLRDGGEPGRFLMPAERRWCSWNGLFGGALLGAAVEAMEKVADKPLLSLGALYLKGLKENDVLEVRAQLRGGGKAISQATAAGLHKGDTAVLAQGTLGAFPEGVRPATAFTPRRPPEESRRRESLNYTPGGVTDTLDVRFADEDVARGANRAQLWVRCVAVDGPMTAAILTAVADHPPSAVAPIFGQGYYGITLDSTMRIATRLDRYSAGEWVLLDVQFDALTEQLGHATVQMWSRSGDYLGVAAQTTRIRKSEPAKG